MKQFHGLSCWTPCCQLKFHSWNSPLNFPRFVHRVWNWICQVFKTNVRHISCCLNSIQGVLSALSTRHTSSNLLQVPHHTKCCVLLGCKSWSHSQGVGNSFLEPALMTTPRVVTGLWFSLEAIVNPLERVDTLSGSALTNSLSVFTWRWNQCQGSSATKD